MNYPSLMPAGASDIEAGFLQRRCGLFKEAKQGELSSSPGGQGTGNVSFAF